MHSNLFRSLLISFMLWAVTSDPAIAQSARVAVTGDPSMVNLVDVTASQLSTLPDLTVLDRADLDKLGQEQEIQTVLNSKDYSPIRLLPADGLVLLRAVIQNGKTGVFARLVAVQPGIILREVALPDGADPSTQAQALEKEFAPYWSKLAALHKGKVTAFSLLGLRFEVDAPETRDLERSINVLLASRLGAEPDAVVLERWRLKDALFEKTLTSQQSSPFWTGGSLVDGSMRIKKDRLFMTLRLRPAKGPELSIQDEDSPQNLPALVGRLADKIRGGASAAGAWNPTDEAHHFAELGKWCLDNGLAQESAEAIESALALGDKDRSTHLIQVKAYAIQAYPDNLRTFPLFDDFRAGLISPDSLVQHVESARMAATLMRDYLKDNPDGPNSKWTTSDPDVIGARVLFNCLRVLRTAYENGFQDVHADDVGDMRHAIRKLIGDLDGRILPRPDGRPLRAYLHHRASYASLWHDTPEETLAFYRENFDAKFDGSGIRGSLYQFDSLHPPFLDDDSVTDNDQEGRLLRSSPSFRGTPFIVAWDGRPANNVKVIWRKFLNELAASPDPVLQADALKLELKSTLTDAGRNACVARFVIFIQQHADSLSGPRATAFAAGFDNFFSWMERGDNADARQKLTALYLGLMKQHANLPGAWIDVGTRFLYGSDKLSTAETQDFLSTIDDYTKWYGSQTPQEPKVLEALGETRQIIFRAKPELTPETEVADALPVTRFWNSSAQVTQSAAQITPRYLSVGHETLTVSDNQLWFMTIHPPYQIFAVDPTTLQVVSTYTIPDELESVTTGTRLNVQSLDVSAKWLAVGIDDRAYLYSRVDNQWRKLDLPPFIYKPRFVNQDLYLLYRPTYDPKTNQQTSEGSGIIHVALPAATIENMVSSRRIPPQTALDGQLLGSPLDLWFSQGRLTLAVASGPRLFRAYATPVEKNAWSLLTSVPEWCQVRLTSGGALIGARKTRNFFAQMSFIGTNGNALLLSNPDTAADYPPENPLWNLPEGIRSPTPANGEQVSAIMRGDDLVLYINLQNGMADGKEASLYYFTKGQKDAVKIPLAFDAETLKNSRPGQLPTPALNFEDLQATDYGLVIYGVGGAGFWIIPWNDIDAYRARSVPVPASSPATAESSNPNE